MSAYEDVLDWARTRPPWQQQALVRLARGDVFEAADFSAIVDQLLSGSTEEPQGGWLAGIQAPRESSAPPVRLTGIGQVSNVNRLAEGQELAFAETGITVVYGHNASGKSGYARLIKQLVRSRHRDPILPDIFTSTDNAQGAELRYKVGDNDRSITLADETPAELKQISYYDERCGDVYVTSEGQAAYRPRALRLLDDLIGLCDGVRDALDERLSQVALRRTQLPALPLDTSASAFLHALSGSTTDEQLAAALTPPADVRARLAAAKTEVAHLLATNPKQEAERLTRMATAYRTLENHLLALTQQLADEPEQALRGRQKHAIDTRAAADAASTATFDTEPLAGVGQAAWRALWSAAERYSASLAYPSQQFPVVEEDSHCVLCQQPLVSEAKDRLTRFRRFMIDDTETQAEEAALELASHRRAISNIVIQTPAVAVALNDIAADEPGIHEVVVADLRAWEDRRQRLLDQPVGDAPAAPGPEGTESCARKAQELTERAAAIDPTEFTERLAVLARDQAEMSARLMLSGASEQIKEERDRRRDEQQLREARRQTDTRGISRESGELTTKHVTVLVQDRFSRESQELQVESVTLLGQGVRHGAVLHKPGFVGAVVDAEIPQVLSEGEQTALGLAGFFVDAFLDPTKSALVFDDPVTSLDHLRREHVARRLVHFAADRQVIVFTHDVSFAADLKRCAGEQEVDFSARTVERRGAPRKPGYCRDGHPWAAQDAQARLGSLKQDLVRIGKEQANWDEDTYEREVGAWAGRLSETWERFVSQDLAGSIFDRGTQEVRPMMLKVVAQFSEQDNKEFQEAYKRISRWATRHDKDASLNYAAPTVEELGRELEIAETWYGRVKRYKNRSN